MFGLGGAPQAAGAGMGRRMHYCTRGMYWVIASV